MPNFISSGGFLQSSSTVAFTLFLFVSGAQAEARRELPRELLRLRVAGKLAAFAQYKMDINSLAKEPPSAENAEEAEELIRLSEELVTDFLTLYRESPATYEGLVVSKEWLNIHGPELAQVSKDYARAVGDKNEEGSRLLALVYGLTPSEGLRELTLARSQQRAVSEAIHARIPGRAGSGQLSDDDLRAYIQGESNPSAAVNYGGIDPDELPYRKRGAQGAQYGGTGGRAITNDEAQTDLLIEIIEREKAKARTSKAPKTGGDEQTELLRELVERNTRKSVGNAAGRSEGSTLREQAELPEHTQSARASTQKPAEADADAAALFRRGAALMKEKRYDDAIRVLTSAIEASRDNKSPEAVRAKQMRALAYELKEQAQ